MSTANFEFFSKDQQSITTVVVDLLDTPASRAWQFAVKLNSPKKNIFARTTAYYLPEQDWSIINNNLMRLKISLDNLSGTEFAYPDTVPTQFEQFDQPMFNRLHRHFTDCCRRIWDPRFIDFDLQQSLNHWLQQLNSSLHLLEQFVATPQKTQWYNIGQELFACSDGSETSYDIMPVKHCHSYEHSDLILDPHILGKTLIESFMCDDDPVNWDTNGHIRTNGGCCFILSDHRQQIYQSLEFAKWLEKHGTNPELVHADVALGNFAPGHKQRLLDFMHSPEFLGCYSLVNVNI